MKIELTRNEVLAYAGLGVLLDDLLKPFGGLPDYLKKMTSIDIKLLMEIEIDDNGNILDIEIPYVFSMILNPEELILTIDSDYISNKIRTIDHSLDRIGKWMNLFNPKRIINGLIVTAMLDQNHIVNENEVSLVNTDEMIRNIVDDIKQLFAKKSDDIIESISEIFEDEFSELQE